MGMRMQTGPGSGLVIRSLSRSRSSQQERLHIGYGYSAFPLRPLGQEALT
jgi:hypothetical protein